MNQEDLETVGLNINNESGKFRNCLFRMSIINYEDLETGFAINFAKKHKT
jgi:hypothetical protein